MILLIRQAFAFALSVAAASAACAAAPSATNHALSCDGIRVNVGGNALMTVAVDGVPFISSTDFAAVKPGWKGSWYTTNRDYALMSRSSVERNADGSGTVTLSMLPRDGGFEGTMTLTLMSGRRLGVAVDAVTTSEPAGLMEGRVAAIFGGWIAGRPYTAELDGGTSTGVLPAVCRSEKLAESILLRGFRKLEVDTRGGPLTVTVEGSAPVSLVDYRLNTYANNLPIYWMGPLERKVKAGERIRFSVLFQLPPAGKVSASTVEARKALVLQRDAVAPDAADLIIPTPKKVEWRTDDLRLRDGARIAVSSPEVLDAAKQFAAFVLSEHGLSLSIAETPPGQPETPGVIRVRLGKQDVQFPDTESYGILVTESAAEVDAATSVGALHAMRTLRQLLRARDGQLYLRACSVEDWPTFPYRGVHMFGGPGSPPFVTRMIGEILGPLKVNQFHFQCEYIRWDSHPELWNPKRGMEKADALDIARAAWREAMEVTPLINTFGHSNWLFNGDAHRDLADNPDNPNTYDPSNPEVYRIAQAVYQEAIALFRPSTFNIGHDEIAMYGFPENAANKKAGTRELIRRDIAFYHDLLTTQGIRTMLWSDQFLAPGDASSAAFAPSTTESKARRDALPRDVLIADWHYVPGSPDKYASIGLWSKEGFDAVVCPWDKPGNIVPFARAAALAREQWAKDPQHRGEPMGLLQTTWAGFVNDEKAFLANPEQFAAYLLAAECAWTGGYDDPSQVPFDYVDEFTRMWRRRALPRAGAEGWQVDLSGIANLDLASTATAEWLGYTDAAPLAQTPAGETRMGRISMLLPGKPGSPRALLLAGKFNPPTEGGWPSRVILPVGRRALSVALALGATTDSSPEPPVARAAFRYDDGTSTAVEFRLGQNLFPVTDPKSSVMAPRWWQSAQGAGNQPFAVHGFLWENPEPSKKLRQIELSSTGQGSALMVFGVTGVDPAPPAPDGRGADGAAKPARKGR